MNTMYKFVVSHVNYPYCQNCKYNISIYVPAIRAVMFYDSKSSSGTPSFSASMVESMPVIFASSSKRS